MSFDEHLSEFNGLSVAVFDWDTDPDAALPGAAEVAWCVRGDWGEPEFPEVFERFLRAVDTTAVTSLVIGFWGYEGPAGADSLLAAADRFPNLRALFLGDILDEEYHLSWIPHADITPLFEAFPRLERCEVRGGDCPGGDGLKLRPIRSETLKVLRFESGGLPAGVVRAVAASDLPGLEHLDLWLGVRQYGGDATVDDLAPILTGERLPALRHFGPQNSAIQDDIAAELASAPIVARLESLSLGMGTLTDQGAEALLIGQPLTHLKKLDLHHSFVSAAMLERLRAELTGVELNLEGAQGEQDWHGEWDVQSYVAATE